MNKTIMKEFKSWKSIFPADDYMSINAYYYARGVFDALADLAVSDPKLEQLIQSHRNLLTKDS